MKIHLIRHAKTAPTELNGKDFDRALMTKGLIQSNVLAYHLSLNSISSELTWCSNAIRTRETLSILKQSIDFGKIVYSPELYLCDRNVYLKIIWEQKSNKDLFFVGHNDGISDLARYFTEDDLIMKTSEYFGIEFPFKNLKEVFVGNGKII